MAMKPEATPPFAFTSDRLRLLGPLITEHAVNLARERVLTGVHFFKGDKMRNGLTRRDVKMALILVLEINPREDLDNNEQGVLRGITRKLYAKLDQAGELMR
jgi:hypothetical protein